MRRFWNFQQSAGTEDIELRISGEIVDDDSVWIYEWFGIEAASPNAFRQELSQYAGQNITVWIDSWGGDTTAAAGIYNALKEHKGQVNVKIDGKAVSAASVIAMAGDVVRMSPVAVMMIHNPWTSVSGEAKDMRKVADVLDVVKDTILNAYQLKTGKSRDEISQMMDNETYMSAQIAKNEGFVDEILYDNSDVSKQTAENSFMFTHMAIQNSASASMRKFIGQYRDQLTNKKEENEVPINTMEDLKKEKPDLVNQVMQETIKNERARLAALDAIDDPQNKAVQEIIHDAKANGKTVEEIQSVVDIVKKHAAPPDPAANAAQDFMTKAIQDNKNSGADQVLAGNGGGPASKDERQEMAAAASYMADIMNKKHGRGKQ
jgi:ATP-dependent Clp protease protease subunit